MKRGGNRGGTADDHIQLEADEFRRKSASPLGVAGREAIDALKALTFSPTPGLKRPTKSLEVAPGVGIVFGQPRKDCGPADARGRLRLGGEWRGEESERARDEAS